MSLAVGLWFPARAMNRVRGTHENTVQHGIHKLTTAARNCSINFILVDTDTLTGEMMQDKRCMHG